MMIIERLKRTVCDESANYVARKRRDEPKTLSLTKYTADSFFTSSAVAHMSDTSAAKGGIIRQKDGNLETKMSHATLETCAPSFSFFRTASARPNPKRCALDLRVSGTVFVIFLERHAWFVMVPSR